jgi:hypothetical protein
MAWSMADPSDVGEQLPDGAAVRCWHPLCLSDPMP